MTVHMSCVRTGMSTNIVYCAADKEVKQNRYFWGGFEGNIRGASLNLETVIQYEVTCHLCAKNRFLPIL